MKINTEGIVCSHQSLVGATEIYPGVRRKVLYREIASGRKVLLVEIDAGAKFLELDVHEPGSEDVFVLEGIFNDGISDYPAGTFIHHPIGSSHIPQSAWGCKLLVYYPEG